MARKFFEVVVCIFMLAAASQLGPRLAQSQVPVAGEVAALSGTVQNGETIPLPTYRDGTVALESECRWIVSLGFMAGQGTGGTDVLRAMDEIHCSAPTRAVSVYACNGSPTCSNVLSGVANYLIIATRGSSGPTSVGHEPWGQLKSRYAPKSGPTSQTPTDR